MKQLERIVGSIIATMLLVIIGLSIILSLFTLLFRDGRGLGLYGSRGEFYMSE
jgi:hypothetical protein